MTTGFDVRPVVREQIESLGANWLDLGVTGAEAEGGYARELTPEEMAAQQQALEGRIADFDAVITTAAVPGRPAPKIIPASAVEAMRPGSVIVDLAAETGGNCELTEPGEIVQRAGVTLVGLKDLPSTMPYHASTLLLAERPGAPPPPRAGGRAHARLERRDHERRLRRREAGRSRGMSHNTILVFEITILVLAIFLGVEVISKVPTLLHTPLMSGTNAIHGVVIVGAMIVLGQPDKSAFTWIVGFAAVVLAAANVVGGFVVTDRMLEMFKSRERPKKPDET